MSVFGSQLTKSVEILRRIDNEHIRILLIEDSSGYAELMGVLLTKVRGAQFDLVCAKRLSKGLERLDEGDIDVILLDLSLPDSRGLDTFFKVYHKAPGVPIIVLTAIDDEAFAVKAVQAGAQDYLVKGQVDRNLLVRSIHYAIERHRIQEELRRQAAFKLQCSEVRFLNILEQNADGIIIVDKKGVVLYVNPAAEVMFGRRAEELVGEQFGYPLVAGKTTELEVVRGGGGTVAGEMRVVETQWGDEIVYLASLRDITERKRSEEELRRSSEKLQRALDGIIQAMALTTEMRDPYTAGHQQRVASLTRAIAEEMSLSEEQIRGIHTAAVMHDIGKIYIPAEILSKPGDLTEIEFSLFKTHPQIAYDILKTIEFPWPVAKIVLQHHERMDGSGYPHGISGDAIIREARVLAVADVVEAMASHRPYRAARGTGDALEEISHHKDILYDSEVVDACLRVFYYEAFKFEEEMGAVTSPKKKLSI